MTDGADVDWATGLSQRVQQLACEGVSHEQIDRFIHAKRIGDSRLVAQILAEPKASRLTKPTRDESAYERALTSIRIAALRPEVNQLQGPLLLDYVLFILEMSEQIVKARADDSYWESNSVVVEVAQHIRDSAIEWLRGRAAAKTATG